MKFNHCMPRYRSIWYGTDMTGQGKLRSDWNVALLEVCAALSVQEEPKHESNGACSEIAKLLSSEGRQWGL